MSPDQKVRDFLTAIRNEPVKMKRVYDGSNRVITQYEAVTHAQNGDPCMKTVYTYVSTSNFINTLQESLDVWLTAYET